MRYFVKKTCEIKIRNSGTTVPVRRPKDFPRPERYTKNKTCGTSFDRGKEKSLSCCLGSYYKLLKSDPNAVFFAPKCCLLAASFVRAGQCDNSLYLCTFVSNQLDWSNNLVELMQSLRIISD